MCCHVCFSFDRQCNFCLCNPPTKLTFLSIAILYLLTVQFIRYLWLCPLRSTLDLCDLLNATKVLSIQARYFALSWLCQGRGFVPRVGLPPLDYSRKITGPAEGLLIFEHSLTYEHNISHCQSNHEVSNKSNKVIISIIFLKNAKILKINFVFNINISQWL